MMTEARQHGEQEIEIGFDIKKSFFIVKDKRDKNRVFDGIMNYFTRPKETIVIPNLFSENYVRCCLTSGRNVVGYLAPNKLIYTKDRGFLSEELTDASIFTDSEMIFEKCKNQARLFFCDFPNFNRDTKSMLGISDYTSFVDKFVSFYSLIIKNCLQTGGTIVIVSQNIVISQRGDTLPLTHDVVFKMLKNNDIRFKGDIIWSHWDSENFNKDSVYTCVHKSILMFEKIS